MSDKKQKPLPVFTLNLTVFKMKVVFFFSTVTRNYFLLISTVPSYLPVHHNQLM